MNDQQQAAAWAREVLADPRTVVLDTETTDLRGYACQVTVMLPDGTMPVDTIVNPLAPVNPGARRIHRITDEEMAAAPTFADLWPALQDAITGRRVIVYHAEFDFGVIGRELHRLALPAIPDTWECAMKMYAQWVGDWDDYHNHYRWHRLNGGHRSPEDCLAVYKRLREMAGSE